jgi:hypothetical protein
MTTVSYLAFPRLWVNGIVQTGFIAQAKDLLQKKLGIVPENWVQGKMMQAPMFFSLVVAEIDEILNVVM